MIKVLIVEDDPMVAELNRRYVSQVNGFTVAATAKTSDEALALLQDNEINLVLLDIFLPGAGGLELLTKIRTLDIGVDVIVVSAARDKHTIQTALRYGAVDYLIKPFEFERLNAALTAYRNLVAIMEEPEIISQNELDRRILSKELPSENQVPKGLDKNTLKLVWESVIETKDFFTTEELAGSVGISRVSMRKYLDFLKSTGVLKLEINYGSVGRPVYKYRCVNHDPNFIKKYI